VNNKEDRIRKTSQRKANSKYSKHQSKDERTTTMKLDLLIVGGGP